MAFRRLQKELHAFDLDTLFIHLGCVNDNIFEWRVVLVLPPESPLEGGSFTVDIKFPSDYPFKPPRVRFCEPRPFHPIISQVSGDVDLDLLTMGRWSPALTTEKVLKAIVRQMCEASFTDYIECHMNGTAMAAFLTDVEVAVNTWRNERWRTHPKRK